MNNNPLFQSLQSSYRRGLRHNKYRWLIILGTLAYLASPLDISPDILPGIGWIDDGLIATLLVSEVTQLLVEQRKARKQSSAEVNVADTSADVIDVNAVTS